MWDTKDKLLLSGVAGWVKLVGGVLQGNRHLHLAQVQSLSSPSLI